MVLTHEDLAAISQMMDEKLDERDKRWDEKLDAKLDERDKRWEENLDARLDERDKRWDEKLDERLQPIEMRLKRIEVDILENNVLPRLNTIEECYTGAYQRYQELGDRMETAFQDIEIIKKVVTEHSKKLQKLA